MTLLKKKMVESTNGENLGMGVMQDGTASKKSRLGGWDALHASAQGQTRDICIFCDDSNATKWHPLLRAIFTSSRLALRWQGMELLVNGINHAIFKGHHSFEEAATNLRHRTRFHDLSMDRLAHAISHD